MKDTLSIIQLGAQIAKIVSKVLMVVGIVSGGLCLAGIISLATIGLDSIDLFGIDIYGLVQAEAGAEIGDLYISLVTGVIMCAALAVNAGFTTAFFKKEMDAGTPFTFEIAKDMLRLGIIIMAVMLGATIVAGIVEGIMNSVMNLNYSTDLDISGSFSTGLMFLVMSFVCKHGAEVSSK